MHRFYRIKDSYTQKQRMGNIRCDRVSLSIDIKVRIFIVSDNNHTAH